VGPALEHFERDPRSSDSLREIVFPGKKQKMLTKFPGLATSGRHNSAMITDRWKFTTKWFLYGLSSFHFYRQNQFKVYPRVRAFQFLNEFCSVCYFFVVMLLSLVDGTPGGRVH